MRKLFVIFGFLIIGCAILYPFFSLPNHFPERFSDSIPQNFEKFLDHFHDSVKITPNKQYKVAIIGAGITGVSNAYFLKKIFEPIQKKFNTTVQIKVFEKKEEVGGRTYSIPIAQIEELQQKKIIRNGKKKKPCQKFSDVESFIKSREEDFDNFLDLGGDCIIQQNFYARQMFDDLDLKIEPEPKELTPQVIWDSKSKKPIFTLSSPSKLKNILKLFQTYGILDFLRMRFHIIKTIKKFIKVYHFQTVNFKTWDANEKLFQKLGLFQETQQTFGNFFLGFDLEKNSTYNEIKNSRHEIHKHRDAKLGSPDLFNELLIPILRVNYMQNHTISAFAGLVSSAAAVTNFMRLSKGMDLLSNKLLKVSGADYALGTTVTKIEQILSSQKDISSLSYRITTQSSKTTQKNRDKKKGAKKPNQQTTTEDFDFVVLGTPFELLGKHAKIEAKNLAKNLFFKRRSRKMRSLLVVGELNKEKFGLSSNFSTQAGFDVYTVQDSPQSALFHKITYVGDYNDKKKSKIYNIFSYHSLKDKFVEEYFEPGSFILAFKSFYAYPTLEPQSNPSERWHPVKISENFYYPSSLESVISTIETSMIGSMNAALMIAKKIVFGNDNFNSL